MVSGNGPSLITKDPVGIWGLQRDSVGSNYKGNCDKVPNMEPDIAVAPNCNGLPSPCNTTTPKRFP